LPPEPRVTYAAFCDPSGGVNDAMTLAVAHLRDGAVCVLDSILEVRPPFDPEHAVAECAAVLRRFGVTRVVGDRYGGEWPKARFREHGIIFEQSARPKSDIYHDLLPLLNARRVELLERPRLSAQLVGLERRTARGGRDSIDHTPGGHDDLANAAAGVLVNLDLDRRPALVQLRDVLNNGTALPLPTRSLYVVAIMWVDKRGESAVIYSATMPIGLVPPLLLLDYDVGPLHGGLFREIDARIRDLAAQCHAQGAIAFLQRELARHAMAAGLRCEPIPEELIPEELLLSAAHHVGSGSVKLCEPALEKSRTSAFGGALDFRAAEDVEDPLRCAALLTLGLCLDPAPPHRATAR
jgi:hypothetical protein